ncbi:MAG: potassium channel family protein [Culicoidibacterales bacterium]
MKIIIIGAGRLGQGIFWQLQTLHHQVTLIESNSKRVELLMKQVPDAIVVGAFFAQETLEKAGILTCDACIICTPEDEVNAVLARVAKQTYRVPTVIARLYDPLKVKIYTAFGIQTLATTLWGIDRAVELVTRSHLDSVYEVNHGEVRIIQTQLPQFWWGRTVGEFNYAQEIQIVSIQRKNQAVIPTEMMTFAANDHVYIAVTNFASQRLEHMLGMGG